MRPRFSISKRDLGNTLSRGWRVNGTIGVKETAVSMRGVFAEANVRCDVEGGKERAEEFDSENNGTFGVVSGGTAVVLP